jgi:homocitrate synthase
MSLLCLLRRSFAKKAAASAATAASASKKTGKASASGAASLSGLSGLSAEGLLARVSSQKLPEFYIVDSTLREGEQFMSADFSKEDRVSIATMLDRLRVDYIELANPLASAQAKRDCEVIAGLGLKAKVLAHTRCHMDDVRVALDTKIDGVNLYMATSSALAPHSHGKSVQGVLDDARRVIDFVLSSGKEVRFSCEDAFRSNLQEILPLYRQVAQLGVHRVGVADTVGVATPWQVFSVVAQVRDAVGPDIGIEFHTHNDTGCCVANAYMAMLAGATHIDTSVLGIGERNGITPLGGLLARLYTLDPDAIRSRFKLSVLKPLEKYVAAAVHQTVPFNNYITGSSAFTHKAGVHSKAVMKDSSAYEVINPADFGVQRHIQLAHRLTGWNAIQQRSISLGLELSDDELRAATQFIKNLADEQTLSVEQIDAALLQISNGPRVSSEQFVQLSLASKSENADLAKMATQAVKALEAFTVAAAKTAVETTMKNSRPATALAEARVRITGHLFDKNLLNVVMDLLVEAPTQFSIESVQVPHSNEGTSETTIRIKASAELTDRAAQVKQVQATLDKLQQVVSGMAAVAECSAQVLQAPDSTLVPLESIDAAAAK